MSKRRFHKATLFVLSVLFTAALSAQVQTTVRLTADRTKILIGEPIRLMLEADIPENQPIRFFQFDTLPHFEFLSRQKIDTTNTGTGTVLRQVIYITSFDSGRWTLPPLPLAEGIATDSLAVDVVFSEFNPQQPYHDVKDIIEVKPEEKKKKPWWWYAAGGGILLILLLYLLLRKKKKPVVVVEEPPVDPYKEVMETLEGLQRNKPDAKQYYSTMVDAFRLYIAKRKNIHSLQQTSDDLVVQMRSLELPGNDFEQLSQSLRLSDFVKFAKYIPSADDDVRTMDTIKSAIRFIEQMK